jgi:hypothetical protein
MAKLVSLRRDDRAPHATHMAVRYRFDEEGLIAWFGGMDRVRELAGVYGLPQPNRRFHYSDFRKASTMAVYLPVLLELAHRMRKPLELYDFVQELR